MIFVLLPASTNAQVTPPSDKELGTLHTNLFHVDKPVLISLTPKYSDHYIPLCASGVILKPLSHLFDSANFNLLYTELLKKCEEVFAYTSSSSL